MSDIINTTGLDRRTFIATSIAAGAAVLATSSGIVLAEGAAFEVPKLGYDFAALEPFIDAKTMEIHHDKHHGAYVTNLNKALAGNDLAKLTIEDILADKASKVPEAIRQAVINNGGGHSNHSLFWASLAPKAGGEPKGPLADAIKSTFTDFATFTGKMNEAGMKRFGSGWAWLAKTADGKLEVYSTANQDSPIMEGKKPILGIDVWEHAYYLKYQNLRADYLKAIWNVINWAEVEKRF
ncbi:MAG: Fe-Mn family superoxide dismutase [Planctomycetota bacterium]